MNIQHLTNEIHELRQKIQEFDSLVASMDDIVFEISNQGIILNCWTANPEQLFFDKEFIINKSLSELFSEDLSNDFFNIIKKSFRNQQSYSLKYKSPFQEIPVQWFKMQTKIIKNRTDKLTVIITNITREQKLISKIQIKEEKFNRAFINSSIGMLLLNNKLNVIEHNPELLNILNYNSAKEVLEQKLSDFIHEDHLSKILTALSDVKRGRKEKVILEAQCVARGKKMIWCLINISSIRDSSGTLIYFLCQIQDLSLFKNNDKKLNIQNDLLEQVNYELKVKVKQLEAYNQVLTHNLRTPISNIEMIINQLEVKQKEETKDLLINLLKVSNQKFLKLFDNLIGTLDNQNSKEFLFQSNNIIDIIENIQVIFHKEIEMGHLEIENRILKSQIVFPSLYIQKIFQFLILETLNNYDGKNVVRINISTWEEDNCFHLSIENNCPLKRLFSVEEGFPNIDNDIDENLLMDIYMAKQQIHYFGGNISISTVEENGNKITISLPNFKLKD